MPSAFVPFLKTGGKSAASPTGAARTASADTAAGAGAFAALVPSGPNPPPPTGTPTCAAGAHPATGKPTVSLQKEGDRVTHIRIQCGCGEVIELACDY